MTHRQTSRTTRLFVQPLENRTVPTVFVVTTPADSVPGSLRQMIANANANPGADIVRFEIPTTQPGPSILTLIDGEIAITDSVSIIGFGPTVTSLTNTSPMIIINGNNTSRIFNINGLGTLSVNCFGIGFTNGKTDGSGGAIINASENLAFLGCTFIQNSAGQFGGAVATIVPSTTSNPVPHVNFNYSRLSNNQANDGGAVYSNGIMALAIQFSSFLNNHSTGKGGAITVSAGGRVTIDSSTLAYNSADTAGGGLSFTGLPSNTPPLTAIPIVLIRNSTLSNNQAKVIGGGVALASFNNGVCLIANSTVTQNSAGKDSPILTTAGGGIHVAPSSNSTTIGQVTLSSSIVSDNLAPFGADIFTPGKVASSYSALGTTSGIATYIDNGNNLPFGIELKLGSLQDNGGPTLTHLPAADSPLINSGSNLFNLRFDQRGRGYDRVSGGQADIGAVERQFPTGPTPTPFDSSSFATTPEN